MSAGLRQLASRMRAWWPAAAVALLLFYLVNGDVYLDMTHRLPLPASVTFTAGALLLLAVAWRREPGIGRSWAASLRAVGWVVAAMLLVAAIRLAGAFLPGAGWQTGSKHMFLSLFDAFVFTAMVLVGSGRGARTIVRPLFAAALVVLVATVASDLLVPGLFSRDLTRGAGLAVNANTAALYVVVLLTCALDWRRFHWSDALLATVGAVGVLGTLSRSGAVLLVLVLAGHVATTVLAPLLARRPGAQRRLVVLVVATAAFLVIAAAVLERTPFFAQATARRRALSFVGRGALVSRDESRLALARDYWRLVQEAPLLGHGTAFASERPRGPHNMYLLMWVENGVVGLLAYLAWLGSLLHFFGRRGDRGGTMLVLVLVTVSVFDHAVLDHRVSMIAVGLQAARTLARGGAP